MSVGEAFALIKADSPALSTSPAIVIFERHRLRALMVSEVLCFGLSPRQARFS